MEPGNTPFSPRVSLHASHGCSLADYHALHTARCFATGIAIFLVHWATYVRFLHAVPSRVLRGALCAVAVLTYLLGVLYLHPWQPYWIRELSVMLAQLYAWKVADLAFLRHGEQLPNNFWSFILFDILVLRPPALVLPWRGGDRNLGSAFMHTAIPSQQADALKQQDCRGATKMDRSADKIAAAELSGVVRARSAPASKPKGRAGGDVPNLEPALRGQHRKCAANGGADCTARSTHVSADATAASARSCGAAPLASAAPGFTKAAPLGCCDDAGSTHSGTACRGGAGRVVVSRLRTAAAAVAGPLRDFCVTYSLCEAVNAYLMHRPAEDVLSAPLLVQAWLSTCFATALYLHLRYFFYSMEMLWLGGFALFLGVRLERWEPLFNSPERSTSPVDFWNNRWHQAFRWWWTRLVFLPVRRALKRAIARLAASAAPDEPAAQCAGKLKGRPVGAPAAPPPAPASAPTPARRSGSSGAGSASGDSVAPKPGPMRARSARLSSGACNGSGRGDSRGSQRGHQPGRVRERSCSNSSKARGGMFRSWVVRHQEALLLAAPTLAVFAFSGLFHESLLWINFGRPTGEQAAFFMLHAALLLAQRAAERAAPRLCRSLAAAVPAPLRAAAFMSFLGLTSVIFFRPWFRNSYHRELRVLFYGPTGWAVRVWGLGMPREQVRLW